MKKTLFSVFVLMFLAVSASAQVDKIVGKWKTIDDKDGSEKSIVNIFKASNGKYYGKVEKLFKEPNKKCTECEGENKDKPVLGMTVLNNMVEKDGTLTGGTIIDPANGKVYKCNVSLDTNTGKLKVRGSLDKRGVIGRTQHWVKN
ncbi:MAG TPA: DUF2147 domain-containing protein [Paludibacteraceae bacterium]|nr:DUF2147 domain-containing protein [Paludibacteraceae bacterium]